MSGLRALAEWLVSLDDPANIEQRKVVSLTEIIPEAREALADSAPVASRDRVAEFLRFRFDDEEAGIVADALLAAGVFRDEAEVKAEALRDAAVAWAGADEGDPISAFLDARAAALRAGEFS